MIGVYFLILGGRRVVYVGQSVNIVVRIARHATTLKSFDSWAWTPCDVTDLNETERKYLDRLLPAYNMDRTTRGLRGDYISLPLPHISGDPWTSLSDEQIRILEEEYYDLKKRGLIDDGLEARERTSERMSKARKMIRRYRQPAR